MRTIRAIAVVIVLLGLSTDTQANISVGVGLDTTLDATSEAVFKAEPWIETGFSFSGYPTMALSWFADGAGKAALPLSTDPFSATGLIIAGGSLRSGLTTFRLDVEGVVDYVAGVTPPLFEITPAATFSMGTADFSIYAEGGASLVFPGADSIDFLGRGKIGGSISILNQLAPAIEANATYTSYSDSTYAYTIGASLDTPWYPSFPGTFAFTAGGLRSEGNSSLQTTDGSTYYPDRYWEFSWDTSAAFAFSRTVSARMEIPGAIEKTDHGAIIDGGLSDTPQVTTTVTPSAELSITPIVGLSIAAEVGSELRMSNSPGLRRTFFYSTIETRYSF